MKRTALAIAVAVLAMLGLDCKSVPKDLWRSDFNVHKTRLRTAGASTFCRLEPGYRLVLQETAQAETTRNVITVLPDTEMVDGVMTRVVEERETENGELIEVSRNFFAIDESTDDIYYFGEAVDIYKNGRVSGHAGSWRSGVARARFGLAMPGTPEVGRKYYQEIAPDVAMDRAEVKSISDTCVVPAGTFSGCLRTDETTRLEPGVKETKYYAPGVGVVLDAGQKLIEYGR